MNKIQLTALVRLIVAALCLGVTGCGSVSVTVQSTKDAQAVHKVERLFVIINHGDLGGQSYSEDLAHNLRLILSNPPPDLEIGIVSPLDLDEKQHGAKIKQFKPDAVLVIRLTTAVLDPFGGYPILKYDASLFDAMMKKRLWRGAVDNSGEGALVKLRMSKMAEVLVTQLRKDGFL